jgi:hypothetical protein
MVQRVGDDKLAPGQWEWPGGQLKCCSQHAIDKSTRLAKWGDSWQDQPRNERGEFGSGGGGSSTPDVTGGSHNEGGAPTGHVGVGTVTSEQYLARVAAANDRTSSGYTPVPKEDRVTNNAHDDARLRTMYGTGVVTAKVDNYAVVNTSSSGERTIVGYTASPHDASVIRERTSLDTEPIDAKAADLEERYKADDPRGIGTSSNKYESGQGNYIATRNRMKVKDQM